MWWFGFLLLGERNYFISKQVKSQALHQEGKETSAHCPSLTPVMTPVCQVMDRMKVSLCGILKRTLGALGLGMIPADTAGVSLLWRCHLGGGRGLKAPSLRTGTKKL